MRLANVVGVLALGAPAVLAEPPAKTGDSGTPAVDPERLEAAKDVVRRAQGDRDAVIAAMRTPMVGMLQQMGMKETEKAKVAVEEVVLPVLSAHYEDLLSIQAASFASALSTEDLKAIAAFYASPAGRSLVKAQPQLTQAMLSGLQNWVGSLQGEIREKVGAAAEAHGWNAEPGKPTARPAPK